MTDFTTKTAMKHDGDKVRMDAMPICPKCGNNRQVWENQITGLLTCHRAFCDTVISLGDRRTNLDDRWRDAP